MLSIICHLRSNFLAIPKMNYMNNDELHSQEIEKMFLFHCQYNPSNISVLNIFEISRMRSLFREFRFFFRVLETNKKSGNINFVQIFHTKVLREKVVLNVTLIL